MPAPIYTQITQQLAARQIERRRSVRRTAAKRLSGSSELRDIYTRMAKRNASSPLYLLQLNTAKRHFLIDMKEDAMNLSMLLDELDPAQSDLYSSWLAVSDHPLLASADLTPDAAGLPLEKLPEPALLQIHSLALPQRNIGNPLYAAGRTLEPGLYRFQAEVEDNLYQLQFNISPGSTNEDILTKLARFIGKSSIGIHAKVDGLGGERIRMRLESEHTGRVNDRTFTLTDIEYPSSGHGLIDFLGLNHLDQSPANAYVTLNGASKELMNNEFTLKRSLHVSLLKASEESIRIGYAPDTAGVKELLEDFLNQYNSFLWVGETAKANHSGSSALYRNLSQLLSWHSERLGDCGIYLSDGRLAASYDLVSQSLEDGSLPSVFAGDSPFVVDLKNELNQIALDPVQYTTKEVVTYPNTTRQNFLSPYAFSLYSGLFYNECL